MLIECILVGSCSDRLRTSRGSQRRPVMALAVLDVTAEAIDYRQTERDFLLGGFQQRNPMLRPMLGHRRPSMPTTRLTPWAAGLGDKMRTSHIGIVRKL